MTILLDINNFKEYLDIHPKLTIKQFEPYINLAQERFLKPILCETTLDSLKTAYEAGNLSGNNLNLYNEVKPGLVFRSYELWVQESSVIKTVNGLKQAEDIDGTSSVLSDERREALISKYKENAAFFENRLITYLEINKDTYTDWKNSVCYSVKKRQANYIQGIQSNKSVKPLQTVAKIYETGKGN